MCNIKFRLSEIASCSFFHPFLGTPNRNRREKETTRGIFASQTSSVTEGASDEVEQSEQMEQDQEGDDDAEPARVTS